MHERNRVIIACNALKYIDSIPSHVDKPEVGFLIGQIDLYANIDTIITCIKLQPESDEQHYTSIQDISIEWLKEYAKQIDRLLVGGLSIIGMYVVSNEDCTKAFAQVYKYLNTLRQYLMYTSTFISELPTFPVCLAKYALYKCMKSNATKWQCLFPAVDEHEIKSKLEFRQVEVSLAPSPIPYKMYSTCVALNESYCIATQVKSTDTSVFDSLNEQLQYCLLPLARRVAQSIAILNKVPHSTIESDFANMQAYEKMTLLTNSPVQGRKSQCDSMYPNSSILRFNGGIRCMAVVFRHENSKHDIQLSAKLLKQDFIKSLAVRVELLQALYLSKIEEHQCTNKPYIPPLTDDCMLVLPTRVLLTTEITSGGLKLPYTIYSFHEDDVQTSVANALEILNAMKNVDEITLLETFPVVPTKLKTLSKANVNIQLDTDGQQSFRTFGFMITLGILLLALIVHMF